MDKPEHLIGRDQQWRMLTQFLRPGKDDTLRLGIVSGRRRTGKTYLLSAVSDDSDGLYHVCVRDEGPQLARNRFAATIAEYAGTSEISNETPDSWEQLLRTALSVADRRKNSGITPPVVIDEFPYAMEHSPELPGLIQLIYDQSQYGKAPGGRLILCGSALSVMRELLSGTKPLRGRAMIDMRLRALDYRQAAALWGIGDPETALHVHSCVGGFPRYRRIIEETPSNLSQFNEWVPQTLLNIDASTFSRFEVDYLLREDPRITDLTVYYDLLWAVANGSTSLSKIGAAIGRTKATVRHPVDNLKSAGYLDEARDLLRKRSTVTISDPIIRFDRMIAASHIGQLELNQPESVWRTALPTFRSRIVDPHFEAIARERLLRFAPEELSRPEGFGDVGCANIHDHKGRASHEIDVLAVQGKRVNFLGEAKATLMPRDMPDLQRLEHVKDVLSEMGYETSGVILGLFARYGFSAELEAAARGRSDVELVDLDRLYGR